MNNPRGILNSNLAMRREAFRKKFQRSGSLGIPFVPESEIANIKEYWSFDRGDGAENDQCRQGALIVAVPTTKPAKLTSVLQLFEDKHLSITHIETRDSKKKPGDLEVLMQFETSGAAAVGSNAATREILTQIKENGLEAKEVNAATLEQPLGITNGILEEDEFFVFTPSVKELIADSPWFPRTIFDLDKSSKRVLMYGTDLDADHPGFTDVKYRQRRMMFADIALSYRHGQPIPRIEYTEEEKKTWSTIYRELRGLHKKYACEEYMENFALLERYCGYGEHDIPQLQDVSKFLKAKTGFQIRPVAGYLSSRDFLAGLAFRVFHCTQYIRHPSDPFYTPEPDCCHELLGHMPLFADPDFAQFSQEIGLASLGASEEDVQQLATLYFFTIEFGLCKQEKEMKIYGAGLLSCIGELKHAVEDNPDIFPFDPDRVIKQEPLITTFQTAYFYTESFEDVQQKIRLFTSHIKRPFVVRYNPYTEGVEILNTKRALTLAVNTLRSDVNLLASALHKVM